MIIFDLDGTLADCEYRRHFVDPKKRSPNGMFMNEERHESGVYVRRDPETLEATKEIWKPDWKSFYEACSQDEPIWPVVRLMESLHLNEITMQNSDIEIWSGRCESVRDRTEHWLKYIVGQHTYSKLKMRPIGDNTPDDQLKERWLEETYEDTKWGARTSIQFVFDSDQKSIEMWKRRGIFVFNCCQNDREF